VNRTAPVRALWATALLRIATSLFAFQFAQQVPPHPELASKNQLFANLTGPADGLRYLLFGIWDRFDTLWYLNIASNGYDRPAATVFYPMYPFLIRCLSWVTREPTAAALIISTVACFFLLWGIQELARLDWPGAEAWALAVFALWPASFILLAAYPDSLLIGLAVWSIYFARMNRWWLAGILACAAGLTKAAGVLVVIPLSVLILSNRRWKALPALAIAPTGFLAYTIWLKLSGFPSSNAVYARFWSTQLSMPWQTLIDAFPPVFRDGDWLIALNLAPVLFCLGVLFFYRNLRLDYRVFTAACLILFLIKHTDPLLQSTPRYVLLAFPVFLCWATWIKRRTSGLLLLLLLCPLYFAMLRTFLWWGLIV
jgi:hypothetical protein